MTELSLPPFVQHPVQTWSVSRDYGEARELHQFEAQDSVTTRQTRQQVDCISISNPLGAPWVYFKTGFPPDIQSIAVTVRVRVFCEGEQSLWIEYDSADESVTEVSGQPGAFKKTKTINTEFSVWDVYDFVLPDLRPTGRINGGDFRVVCTQEIESPFYLEFVEIWLGERREASLKDRQSRLMHIDEAARSLSFGKAAAPLVSIIIPFLDGKELTQQCLLHLKEYTDPIYEVILVDDGSSKQISKRIKAIPGIAHISNRRTQGYAKSCNIGAKAAKGKYLVFLNNDTIPRPGWLTAQLACMERHPNAGVVGSKLVYPESDRVQHAGLWFDSFGSSYHMHRYHHRSSDLVNHECLVPAVTGACMLTPRKLFHAVGRFDEGYTNGYEDTDYCLRVSDSGREVFYCPSSELFHYESATDGRRDTDRETGNKRRFLDKWAVELALFMSDREYENRFEFVARLIENHGYPTALEFLGSILGKVKGKANPGLQSLRGYAQLRLLEAFLHYKNRDTQGAQAALEQVPEDLSESSGPFSSQFLDKACAYPNRHFNVVDVLDNVGKEKPRVAIYTAFFGDNGDLLPPITTREGIDFICFSDRDHPVLGWEVKKVERTTESDVLETKKYKLFPWDYLADYEYSLFVDAGTLLIGNLGLLVSKYLLGHRFVGWCHPERDCLVEECFKAFLLNHCSKQAIFTQLSSYIDSGVRTDVGLIEASFLWRDHRDQRLKSLMSTWWDHINTHSLEDQVSLGYLMASEDVRPETMPPRFGTGRDNVWLRKRRFSGKPLIGAGVKGLLPGRNPRPCVFLYSDKYRSSSFTVSRCFQAVDTLNRLKPNLEVSAINDSNVKNSLVVLTKDLLKDITFEDIERLKSRGNIIAVDFIDDPIRPDIEPIVDVVIAASITAYLTWSDRYEDKPVFHVTHAVDSRLPETGNTDDLRMGYFGTPEGTILNDRIEANIDVINTDSGREHTQWMHIAKKYTCHYIVRPRKKIDGFRPFVKGFTAAHFMAPIIVENDNPEVQYYLGPDYPFLVNPDNEEHIVSCIDNIKHCYGTRLWVEMVGRMDEVRSRSSRQYFADEFEAMMRKI